MQRLYNAHVNRPGPVNHMADVNRSSSINRIPHPSANPPPRGEQNQGFAIRIEGIQQIRPHGFVLSARPTSRWRVRAIAWRHNLYTSGNFWRACAHGWTLCRRLAHGKRPPGTRHDGLCTRDNPSAA